MKCIKGKYNLLLGSILLYSAYIIYHKVYNIVMKYIIDFIKCIVICKTPKYIVTKCINSYKVYNF